VNFSSDKPIDVALLLEGTYPYVAGGVSSWVHQIIRGFPELSFALVFIGSRAEDYGKPRYEIPPNVVHAETHYLFDSADRPPVAPMKGDPKLFELVHELHDFYRSGGKVCQHTDIFGAVADQLTKGLGLQQFLYSECAWHYIREQFARFSTDPSFVDYFWTVRSMHAPVWKLVQIRDALPPARLFHTVSTGYAGFLGALAKRKFGRPLLLSEHGIYTKERKVDLLSAQWISDNRSVFQRDSTEISYFRQLWIRFFEALGRSCYDAADEIVALYEVNRLRQIAAGADPARTRNIPNGIDVQRYLAARSQRPQDPPPVLCLIGRVVPIKDVKTFIRAMRSVADRVPGAQGWIAGPMEEDAAYARDCEQLVRLLGLDEHVKFLGFQNLVELLPRVGLNVLSSISEALPLVLLEGFAAGVPALCTDVGSCRQLVEGLEPEDRALGAAGAVVNIADPQALADQAVALLTDPARWHAAAQAGIRRVETYYAQELMFGRYRELYINALAN
jgi:glycosyltransferase involved in cell wall biosynthesis